MLIDGDHTYEGLRTDWEGWSPLIEPGGILALHDSLPVEGKVDAGSIRYSNEVVIHDRRFEVVDEVFTLRVLRRRVADASSIASAPDRRGSERNIEGAAGYRVRDRRASRRLRAEEESDGHARCRESVSSTARFPQNLTPAPAWPWMPTWVTSADPLATGTLPWPAMRARFRSTKMCFVMGKSRLTAAFAPSPPNE